MALAVYPPDPTHLFSPTTDARAGVRRMTEDTPLSEVVEAHTLLFGPDASAEVTAYAAEHPGFTLGHGGEYLQGLAPEFAALLFDALTGNKGGDPANMPIYTCYGHLRIPQEEVGIIARAAGPDVRMQKRLLLLVSHHAEDLFWARTLIFRSEGDAIWDVYNPSAFAAKVCISEKEATAIFWEAVHVSTAGAAGAVDAVMTRAGNVDALRAIHTALIKNAMGWEEAVTRIADLVTNPEHRIAVIDAFGWHADLIDAMRV